MRLLTLTLFFFTSIIFAQEFIIEGSLTDAQSGVPLESATVYAEKIQDSTLVTYTISDQNGYFKLIGNSGAKEVNVNISFIGYEGYLKKVSIKDRIVNLENIKMLPSSEKLDGITITAKRAPVTIKKDTLEFNVASFKTKKDANVEDLLKELPGVEVDSEGNITVNGKPVNKILVNGKPFFGDDPTIATRNLTKEIVDKIQVTDTKTDSEAFAGEAGDDENKTINITIDEEKNKGIFGRVAAGGGTDERFEYAGLINYFDNELRVSALGGGNNTNSPGFSFGELDKMFGGARYVSMNSNGAINYGGRNFGGGQGITNSRVGGANFADELGKETEISADYFYSASNSFNNEIRNRENILPDDRFISNSASSSKSETDGHNVNVSFKTEIDSTFQIEIRPQFNYSKGVSAYSDTETSSRLNGDITNQSSTNRLSESKNSSFENRLELTKKYGANGGFFRIRFNNDVSKDENDDELQSNTEIFGDDPNTIIRNQRTDGEQKNSGFEVQTRLRYPIFSKKLYLEGTYTYETDDREDKQSVFDFDEGTQTYGLFNIEQSTDFNNKNKSSKPEIGLTFRGENFNISANVGYVSRKLESDDQVRNVTFKNDFDAIEAGLRSSYSFTKKLHSWMGYRLSNNAPSVGQLSPYVNVTNPLNIRTGNPDLKPTNRHSIYAGVNNYDYQTKSGFFGYLNGSLSNDNVVSKTTTDENFVRTTTFTNVDGVYDYNANLGWNKSKQLDSIRTVKLNLVLNFYGNKTVNFNNEIQYDSRTITFSPKVGIGFTWKDLFTIEPTYSISSSKNTFDLVAFEDETYLQHTLELETNFTYPERFEWNNDINYNYNPDVADGFQKSAVFWNTSVSYSVINNKGLLTLKAYDLLNQNTNARRTSTADYIQDIQSTVLQRYFMLSFSYKFNTLGKKGETDDNGWWD
ncbi:hypothetical protein ULMS_24090 [Patiriisocius marinistellae]|uniref:Outer membrane protein beta-barrel domain-containing protein n=1 Tax=Patiriisocius marinistellae TaxID=2494560 RepID=A0A5J4G3G3_9FLAO|nr:outer membrane beta-barrel protein [Patiriisocius marinistellae]GEQ86901.1 hypothetical protein ULMS_24090 [Patiriisocius marinistellae]